MTNYNDINYEMFMEGLSEEQDLHPLIGGSHCVGREYIYVPLAAVVNIPTNSRLQDRYTVWTHQRPKKLRTGV